MMIQHKGEIIFPPLPTTKIEIGDVVTLMCKDSKISQILKFFVKDIHVNL
jgi:Trk K+ transport system NAD-binding subunit